MKVQGSPILVTFSPQTLPSKEGSAPYNNAPTTEVCSVLSSEMGEVVDYKKRKQNILFHHSVQLHLCIDFNVGGLALLCRQTFDLFPILFVFEIAQVAGKINIGIDCDANLTIL